MKNNLNDKQKLLFTKYGYHALFILFIEIGIVVILSISIKYFDGIYNLLKDIKITELLLALIPLPIGYFIIRVVLSDSETAKQKGNYFLAPLFTLALLLSSKGMIFKIPFLIVCWSLFIITVYQAIRRKIKRIK